ncbi:hypothetical protein ACF08N_17045 [Streptomyces sp. NPDC015127]|uniref:hypothetical protein n=1 Tax=Streptomyces sp. NPDC015127 TaxID=3364939 RepID=UPI0036F8094F
MLHYAIQEQHRAELIRQADAQRLVRQARAARRAARRHTRNWEEDRTGAADSSRYTRAA